MSSRLGPRLRRSVRLALVAALLGAGASACADDPDPADAPQPPTAEVTSLADRCLSAYPDGVPVERVVLEGDGTDIVGAIVGDSPATTAVVLLPQIGPAGLCGWLPYAAVMARAGITSLPMDPCGYGESACDDVPIETQVELAIDHLRDLGADRVVLMGASMGGSQTVRAVGAGAEVDSWVDLSGPSAWEGEWLLDVAGDVDEPGLVVRARSDGDPGEFARARRLAERTGATFVEAPSGHGWDMLLDVDRRPTRVGRAVLEFVCSGRPEACNDR
ncbi:S9 family peptidase [Nocardioides sp. zg-1228]|uniref:alpha/beta hydrolase family protein n=1 Tax=Nocardioides sp. zg-1228 TaxID=2763008 RepID=UPI0016424F2B|nr:alpha/beta hydrolase [Nocardioides sp. zg-1228]MBC2932358.1 alpha/beta hydrolase [Nocardioides sp. zg-1228]QSF57872.1 alpha/beta hydrolase [Nocardioides sp. zg-1228]